MQFLLFPIHSLLPSLRFKSGRTSVSSALFVRRLHNDEMEESGSVVSAQGVLDKCKRLSVQPSSVALAVLRVVSVDYPETSMRLSWKPGT
jgi:hypothetical protein